MMYRTASASSCLRHRGSLDDRLDLVLELLDFVGEGALWVLQHGRRDDVTGDTACAAQICLLWHVDIDNVL